MPAKFYYVLAFREGDIPLLYTDAQPHFLGKTSDLSFKTEPDKTLDLDDGSTEVGSEKLTLSFSVLGAIANPWPLGEIWLVPVISNASFSYGFPLATILRICFIDTDDYHIETKSGDFEYTHFSSSIRYPVDSPAYAYLTDLFYNRQLHLFPDLKNNDDKIEAVVSEYPEYKSVAHAIEDRMIPDQCALIAYMPQDSNMEIYFAGNIFTTIPAKQKGIFIHYPVMNTSMLAIEANLQAIYDKVSAGFKDDLSTYARLFCLRFGGSLDAYGIFTKMMFEFAKINEASVYLKTITFSDIQSLFPDITSIEIAVDSGYLPYLPGVELLTAEM